MVEMVEILDGRLGKRSVERVRYVINNLLHLVIVKYGDISLVLCISTRLRLVKMHSFSNFLKWVTLILASYPGPFTRAVRAGREIKGHGTSRSRMRKILLESW